MPCSMSFATAVAKLISATASLLLVATIAQAQSSITRAPRADVLLDDYVAFIGPQDLYNSDGVRLRQPSAIIRQDRANFHLFGRRDEADTADTFFASRANRAKLESMLADGFISGPAARDIVAGGVLVYVEIYGQPVVGRSVRVEVLQ